MAFSPCSDLFRYGLTRLFPLRCHVCYRSLRFSELCYRCFPSPHSRIERTERCARCFSDSPHACTLCASFPLPSATLQAVYPYKGNIRDLILAMKFNPSRELAAYCGREMKQQLELPPCSIILGIPSGRLSAATRLFTPSAQCAKALADEERQITYSPRVLRVADPRRPRQATIHSPQERMKAVQKAFSVTPGLITGKRVILVDDIVTTGATIMAATRALLHAGAAEVHVRAFAISPLWEESRVLLHRNYNYPNCSVL